MKTTFATIISAVALLPFSAISDPYCPDWSEIRALIDPAGVQPGQDPEDISCTSIDVEILASALLTADNDNGSYASYVDEEGATIIETSNKIAVIDDSGVNFVIRDHRDYEITSQPIQLDETQIVSLSEPLLEALGVDLQQSRWRAISLGFDSTINQEDPPPSQLEAVAYKLFVQRALSDIRLDEDRVVISFALDGSLRKAIGSWRCIDGAASEFWTNLGSDDIADKAADVVSDAIVADELEIRLEGMTAWTYYEVEPAAGNRWRTFLRGKVMVPVENPVGEPAYVVLDFDL